MKMKRIMMIMTMERMKRVLKMRKSRMRKRS